VAFPAGYTPSPAKVSAEFKDDVPSVQLMREEKVKDQEIKMQIS